MSRVILNCNAISVRSELIYGPLHHESASHRIVSHRCYFRALTNAIRSSWLAEETDPGGPRLSSLGGEDAGRLGRVEEWRTSGRFV